jgi:hypothetical protein
MFTLIALSVKAAILASGVAVLATGRVVGRFATANGTTGGSLGRGTTGPQARAPQPEEPIEPSWTVFMRGL